MWIEEIHIDSFGIFRDAHITGLPKSLTLIIGDNEAGKSTLMAFIRQMLFGFPTKRDAVRKMYPALMGGKPGGRLILRAEDNSSYRLEREEGPHGGNVSLVHPDGTRGGSVDLERIRGNATVGVYETIFAFSLTELQSLDTLENEKVNEIIYSAGMGVQPDSIIKLNKALDDSVSRLYKPQGSKSQINVNLKKIDETNRQIAESSSITEEYSIKRGELSAKETGLSELEQSIGQLHNDRTKNDRLRHTYDTWHKLNNKRSEREGLPEIQPFPPGGKEKLTRLLDSIEHNQEEIEILRNSIRNNRQKSEAIFVNRSIIDSAAAIEQLAEDRKRYIDAKRDSRSISEKLKIEELQLDDKLKELGSDWNRERLRNFVVSLTVKEQVRAFKGKLTEAGNRENEAARKYDYTGEILKNAAEEVRKAQQSYEEIPQQEFDTTEVIEERKQRLYDIDDCLKKLTTLFDRKQNLIDRKQDAHSVLQAVRDSSLLQYAFQGLTGYYIAALIMLTGIVSYFIPEMKPYFLIQLVLGILIAAANYILQNLINHPNNIMERRRRKEIDALKKTIDAYEPQIEELEKEFDDTDRELKTHAETLNIDPPDNEKTVREYIHSAEKNIADLRDRHSAQKALKTAESSFEAAERDRKAAEESLKRAEEFSKSAAEEWKTWLKEAEFQSGLTPESISDIFAEIEKAGKDLEVINDLQGRITQMNEVISTFEETLSGILDNPEISFDNEMPPEKTVGILSRELSENIENDREKKRLLELTKDGAAELKPREKKLDAAQNELDELFREAGAQNKDEFSELHELWERSEILDQSIINLQQQFEHDAGSENVGWLDEALRAVSPVELESEREKLDEKYAALNQQKDELLKHIGGLKSEIDLLEKSRNTADLLLDYETLRAETVSLARNWAVNSIGKELLRLAREKYERERQPNVIREAGKHFSAITDGAYKQVISPPEGGRIYVIDSSEKTRNVGGELSRGTAEELYFSIRLGLITDFSKRSEPLPVIMDDTFVNMDDHRAPAAIRTLNNLLTANQVFVFTCHSRIADLVTAEFPGAPVIKLINGTVKQD